MDNQLQESSQAQYITAIEKNLSAWLPVFGKLGQVCWNDPIGVSRSITDIPLSLFNSIMEARLAEDQVEEAILRVIEDARAHNVPVLWWIGPSTQPADLGKYLERQGFTIDEVSPGMAVELANLRESLPVPAGFSIQQAITSNDILTWCQRMAAGFEIPAFADLGLKAWTDLLNQADPKTVLPYIGWLDGRPVATSLLYLAVGAAGIYAVATIPEARRKGIGAAITHYPLQQARSLGYKIGILQASEMGLGVYRSVGFKEYCKISTYYWKPG